MRRIVGISTDKKTLTLDSPLNQFHYSEIETYGTHDFPMQAEVALLTRNIVFQGSTDDVDDLDKYGAHLMLHMQGAIGRISYTEFTNVGQGFIIGRYPMHFHRIDDASESFCIGNAVHQSWARIVAIHDTHFLTVQKNVGYRVYGHNYFIEDGIETNNLLEDNLGISTIQIWTLINTDVTAATFWITNPNNIVRRNRAAGGDWFGFWYQLENRVTGPSSNPEICPDGIEMGIFSNNIAHSYFQGLRIGEYAPRKYPCVAYNDVSNFQTEVWYQKNPPIHAVFSDFIAFKNFEYGVHAQMIGSVEFRNFLIAESRLGGVKIGQTNLTREDEAYLNELVIVGLSHNIDPDTSRYTHSMGLITPRTDFLLVNNVSFYNFSLQYNMIALQSCSDCDRSPITGGKTTKFSNLSFSNVYRKILWNSPQKEIYVDLDGTLSGKKGMLTPYYAHLNGIAECISLDPSIYGNSIFCNESVEIRSLMFRNPAPIEMYRVLEIRILRIPSLTYNMSLENEANFTQSMITKSTDTSNSWDLAFVTGYIYNIHWHLGNLDWTHMNFYPSPVWKPEDKGIVLRFNYSDIREDYLVHINKWGGTLLNATRYNETNTTLDPVSNNYTSADYILVNETNIFSLGINGKENGTIDIDAIRCKLTCPVINQTNITEDFIRLWSNASMWPNATLPIENEIVLIPELWRVLLDVDPPNLARLIIDGELIFDNSRTMSTLAASIIWVRLGNLTAGSIESPFSGNILINMTGNRESAKLLIDSFIDSSSNILAVTGSLKLFGNATTYSWSKLSAVANAGDSTIQLIDNVDWKVGDKIVIAPTESNYSAFETRTIIAISGNAITLNDPLENFHYGDSDITYQADFGTVLDMRGGVGLLTRPIKITVDFILIKI